MQQFLFMIINLLLFLSIKRSSRWRKVSTKIMLYLLNNRYLKLSPQTHYPINLPNNSVEKVTVRFLVLQRPSEVEQFAQGYIHSWQEVKLRLDSKSDTRLYSLPRTILLSTILSIFKFNTLHLKQGTALYKPPILLFPRAACYDGELSRQTQGHDLLAA